jgi:hypothetical protein
MPAKRKGGATKPDKRRRLCRTQIRLGSCPSSALRRRRRTRCTLAVAATQRGEEIAVPRILRAPYSYSPWPARATTRERGIIAMRGRSLCSSNDQSSYFIILKLPAATVVERFDLTTTKLWFSLSFDCCNTCVQILIRSCSKFNFWSSRREHTVFSLLHLVADKLNMRHHNQHPRAPCLWTKLLPRSVVCAGD